MKQKLICWAMFAVFIFFPFRSPSQDTDRSLKVWYDIYNEEYFMGVLPKKTLIDFESHDDTEIAHTQKDGGRFHIMMNAQYANTLKTSHIALLHEMCHIETWSELDQHGRRWQQCMRRLEDANAFEGLL